MVGAINLLGRATALLPTDDDARIELELALGDALQEAGGSRRQSYCSSDGLQAARSDQPSRASGHSSLWRPFVSRREAREEHRRSDVR